MTTKAEREGSARGSRGILSNHVETDLGLPERQRSAMPFRGSVVLLPEGDRQGYRRGLEACPSGAIGPEENARIDLGKCIMCGRCQELEPGVFLIKSGMAQPVKLRGDLIVAQVPELQPASLEEIGGQLNEKVKGVLGRSLGIREVDAGSCNGCEVEVTALSNPVYDLERFGIHFVASPRHADVLLVTGVSSRNMEEALRRTYQATPDPKVVVAVGACACSGGIFGKSYASGGGIRGVVPVDVFVPGCPPRPEAILYGVLLAVDRVKQNMQR